MYGYNMDNNITSIQVTKEIRDRLKELRIYPRETYKEIIIRLANYTEDNKLNKENSKIK